MAATDGTTPAADTSSAAAQRDTDVAASTEEGTQNAPDNSIEALDARLDEQLKEAKGGKPQAEKPAKATAADEPDESSDDENQTDDDLEAKTDDDDDEREKPETAPEVDDDPLAEFEEPKIPTREEINERWKRTPKELREEYAATAEKLSEVQTAISELGGDEGLQVAQSIIKPLLSAEVNKQTAHTIFEGMVSANPAAVAQMSQLFVQTAIDDEQTGAAFADRLLESEFGDGYTADRLRELVALDAQGLIDVETLRGDLGAVRQPTAHERDLETKLRERDETIEQLTGEKQDATSKTEKTLDDHLDRYVTSEAMKVVTPIALKVGWVAGEGEEGEIAESKILHGEMVSAWLDQKVKASPHYEAIQALRAQGNAFKNGEPSVQMRVAMNRLREFTRATFMRAVRTQQGNAYVKAFTGKKTPAPDSTGRSSNDTAAPPRAQPRVEKKETPDEKIARLDQQLEAKLRQTR